MRLPGHVERRAPGSVTVFRELEIPAGPVHALGDLTDAAPVVEQPAATRAQLHHHVSNSASSCWRVSLPVSAEQLPAM
jgi:hypothetical protein